MESSATILKPEFRQEFRDRSQLLKFPRRLHRGLKSASIPKVSESLVQTFTWYCRGYLRKHFHTIRISRAGLPPTAEGFPLVIFSNHASWWDALTMLVVKNEFYSDRTAFAPIDAAMLQKYCFFSRLGFFGVERTSGRGAGNFLRTAEAIMESPQHLLAITPQSRFADVRERPVRFDAGLGHLATRTTRAMFLPVAAEYVFWEERLPEILLRFGEPVKIQPEHFGTFDADCWTALFEQRLTQTQDALAHEAKSRNSEDFQILLHGGSGQGGIYDLWRAVKAKMRGETFQKEHGKK